MTGLWPMTRYVSPSPFMTIPLSYNLRHLWARRTSTLLTVAGIGSVVWIFIMVLAVARSMQERVAATGEQENLMIMSKDAQYEFSSVVSPKDYQIVSTFEGFAKD